MVPKYCRHGQRFQVSFPLTVRLHEESIPLVAGRRDSAFVESTCTENISYSGCYFILSRKLPVGSNPELEITIPNGLAGVSERKLRCRGKVIRAENPSRDGRVGVACAMDSNRFQEVPEERGNLDLVDILTAAENSSLPA